MASPITLCKYYHLILVTVYVGKNHSNEYIVCKVRELVTLTSQSNFVVFSYTFTLTTLALCKVFGHVFSGDNFAPFLPEVSLFIYVINLGIKKVTDDGNNNNNNNEEDRGCCDIAVHTESGMGVLVGGWWLVINLLLFPNSLAEYMCYLYGNLSNITLHA